LKNICEANRHLDQGHRASENIPSSYESKGRQSLTVEKKKTAPSGMLAIFHENSHYIFRSCFFSLQIMKLIETD